MDDLVKRLRAGTGGGKPWMDLHEEAADRIEALEVEVAQWRKAAEFWESCAALTEKKSEALEAQVRAADALAEALTAYNRGGAGPLTGWLDVEQALAAYRATKEGGE